MCQILLVLSSAVEVYAQSVALGEIRVRVMDPSGASAPNAVLTAKKGGVIVSSAITSESGLFRFLALAPGIYDINVEHPGFAPHMRRAVQVTVGQVVALDIQLSVAPVAAVVDVATGPALVELERTQQSNTIQERHVRDLPIDRRDFLAYSLLAPGVVDSVALADGNDLRVVQTKDSGLSFYGSNGRGNNIAVDGGEANNLSGGVRPTLSQEAVQEFQVNRSNYSAEIGGASGGAINIVSKSGENTLHGSSYGFFRHQSLDAADPFARSLVNGQLERIKPPSNRQQFGATLGGPLRRNRTYFFGAFEGLRKDESRAVTLLNDLSIFEPTPAQQSILEGLPSSTADQLAALLTSPPSTREFFRVNSGIFPFKSTDYKVSSRIDHNLNPDSRFTFRFNLADIDERNPNLQELRGISRGLRDKTLDTTGLLSWTNILSAAALHELRVQFNYWDNRVTSNEQFGPEINISGFGFFNRDYTLPSNRITRRLEISDAWSFVKDRHTVKFGGVVHSRGAWVDAKVFLGGRFGFGALPGSVVDPALASTTINGLQAFNLGLAQTYQQAAGDSLVASTDPALGIYIQDSWTASKRLTLNFGLRYEVDDRRDPLPTDTNNFAPRLAFAWDPAGTGRLVFRGGYGIFYSPGYYQIDWVSNALNEIDGRRQLAQVLTTIQTQGPANAGNVFRTLRDQGVLTFPQLTRSITPADVGQFGINFVHEGPLPPLSVLFQTADDLVNSYSQQASLGIERALGDDWSVAASYIFVRTLKIVRAREDNLLPAPIDPVLQIRVWSTPYFKNPLLLQDNVYQSSGQASYNGLILEAQKRFSNSFGINLNYTLSKAIDDVVDFNSDFQANDQFNLRAERALSSFDQRHKFVFYGSFRNPFPSLLPDFTFSPVFRANSGRPFNLLAGFDLNGDRHPTTDRPAHAGRNTGLGQSFWTLDMRVTREIRLADEAAVELIAEAFNVFNHLNYRGVNNTVGNISGPFRLKGSSDRSPSQPLGFTSAFEPRRIQVGFRVRF